MSQSDLHAMVEKARKVQAERAIRIVGTCQEHGEYTQGECDAMETYCTMCPKCVEEGKREEVLSQRRTWLKNNSGIPPRFIGNTFENFIPHGAKAEVALNTLKSYAERFDDHYSVGRSLVLVGKTGTGKTMLACIVAETAAIMHRKTCRYATAYKIVRDIKSTYSNKDKDEDTVIRGYVSPDLLVVDEVGVQFGTDTEKMLLFEVLNGRYEQIKPTIVVSNLSQEEMSGYVGDRVMDRLKDNGGAVLAFDWASHRQ